MVRGTTHTRALLCKVMYVIHDDGSVVFSLQSSEEENKKKTHTHIQKTKRSFIRSSSSYSWPVAAIATRWVFFSFFCVGFLELTMK
jgi:hypothetical protein